MEMKLAAQLCQWKRAILITELAREVLQGAELNDLQSLFAD
jgi:hypothetical protein